MDDIQLKRKLAESQNVRYSGRPVVDTSQPESFVLRNQANEIIPGLFLGNAAAAGRGMLHDLQSLGITGIVNCTNDSEAPSFHVAAGIEYVRVATYDHEMASILPFVPGAVDFIHRHLSGEEKSGQHRGAVLVHCQMGVSRSATVVMAYLMKYHQMSRDEAFITAKTRRCLVSPNIGFWGQLETFEGILRTPSDQITERRENFDDKWCLQSFADFQMEDQSRDPFAAIVGIGHAQSLNSAQSSLGAACMDSSSFGDGTAQSNPKTSQVEDALVAGLEFVISDGVCASRVRWLRSLCAACDRKWGEETSTIGHKAREAREQASVRPSGAALDFLEKHMADPEFIDCWGCEIRPVQRQNLLRDLNPALGQNRGKLRTDEEELACRAIPDVLVEQDESDDEGS